MHNEAFRHTGAETEIESWTTLLQSLRLWEDLDTHHLLQFLRHRFVTGASEWLSGNHDSKQNDKEILGYTDDEWERIWTQMLEDGAWALPHLKDSMGNFLKENDAPEMLIKFIAHDLKAHIIVFDLHLQTIQFISGNHIRSNNVIFESPLLLYATGSHFQAVFQRNHEYFIRLAKDLDPETNEGNIDTRPQNRSTNPEPDFEVRLKEIQKIKTRDRTAELQKEYNTLMRKRNRASAEREERDTRKSKSRENSPDDFSLPKLSTAAQRKRRSREAQSQEKKDSENAKNKEKMAKIRKDQSKEKKDLENKKTRERMAKMREDQTIEKKKLETLKNRERMENVRKEQTKEKKDLETAKSREKMNDIRKGQPVEEKDNEKRKNRERK